MSDDRLTQIESMLHQLATAALRHDNEFSRWSQRMERIEATVADNAQAIAGISQALGQTRERLDQIAEQQQANTQQIAANTEGITDLRLLLRDFLSQQHGNGAV